jgi:5-hydroxyisourate hydrolase-like protein (transthyretin family)
MTKIESPRWPTMARLGVISIFFLALVGAFMDALQSRPAEAAVLSPQALAGFQTTDKLLVNVSLSNPDEKALEGTLRVEMVAPSGRVLADVEQDVRQVDRVASYSVELPATQLPPEKVTLRCQFGKQKFSVPLNQILVVKAHETAVSSSQEFYAGSTAALRCEVHCVKSIAETVPLAGARVDVSLRQKDGKVIPLSTGKTNQSGIAEPRFQVPSVPAGQYKLVVATKSNLGQEKLERDVRIKADPKILLVTDKPLYQPGQNIHIRALALQAFDLKPAAGKDLTFEVEDSKGNKVFKRTRKTSDYGVAAIDFQLADEVNMGDYHIRAILGEQQADKSVSVTRYVLPKFKVELSADKKFYLPKETIHGDLQTDYFFGKPVADSKVKVTASTFDVQFREFQTWEGQTDKTGHAKFEIKLPDYFVGQPLEKGNALVRLEVKVTDTADHTETINKTYPVSDQPIRVSLIPEGGRLVPDMENHIFAAAIYPDGSPAACDVNLWIGKQAKDKPFASVKTNDAGLAEVNVTPKAEQLRQGPGEQQMVEMLGGQQPRWAPKILFDLFAEAKDAKGNAAHAAVEVNCNPLGENILLRLDKAIYKAGDSLKIDLRSSAGLPSAYLDIVRAGQTLLTHWLDVKDGKSAYKLDLPETVFGTLEVHGYQMLGSGEIIRDTRVVYVQPPEGLKIDVKPDKDVHLPGEEGKIRFQVSDGFGKPAAAALGVIVVDEAVYALQDMQPGLEKVYFTLQEELIKPQAQAVYRPAESIDLLVREPELPPTKQEIAQVLLTSIKPKPPAHWDVAPQLERRRKVEDQLQQIGWAIYQHALNDASFLEFDRAAKRWVFKKRLLIESATGPSLLKDPFGKNWTLEDLGKLEKNFTPERLGRAVTMGRIQQLTWAVGNYANTNQAKWFKDGKWSFPDTMLADAAKNQNLNKVWLKDAWGNPIKLIKHDKKQNNPVGLNQFDYNELVSAGPDGKFGTKDDLKQLDFSLWQLAQGSWFDALGDFNGAPNRFGMQGGMLRRELLLEREQLRLAVPGGFGGRGAGGPLAPRAAAEPTTALGMKRPEKAEAKDGKGASGESAGPTRIREFFPETMLWQPSLITDDQGRAELSVNFADSITTWRLSASASSRGGALGGISAPLRVFQDFFVDLDLPVALTQNDEVAFPVAVYNYLKEPQTIKLELQSASWFELTDDKGLTRSLDIKPNEVTAVKFRIKARQIGQQPLTVKATGTKMSDALKRSIEVVPDGRKVERVVTDRLSGRVSQTVQIPENAVADSSKLLVKIYPGIFSQVLEGTEGMLRLPGG